jgi:hypothetical protein
LTGKIVQFPGSPAVRAFRRAIRRTPRLAEKSRKRIVWPAGWQIRAAFAPYLAAARYALNAAVMVASIPIKLVFGLYFLLMMAILWFRALVALAVTAAIIWILVGETIAHQERVANPKGNWPARHESATAR